MMKETPEEFFQKIQAMTGKSKEEIHAIIKQSQRSKHGEIRSMLMERLGLSYGFANTLVHYVLKSDSDSVYEDKSETDVLDDIYQGKKAIFRPIHEAIMTRVHTFGEFDVLPKKGYVSLRKNKQFATIGPKTNTRMEVGLNLMEVKENERLLKQPKGSMMKYIVKLSEQSEVDDELIGWIETAYHEAS